ncbi:MAG: tyrosine-type recombinase/integrase [Acidimicrobiales bacterium]
MGSNSTIVAAWLDWLRKRELAPSTVYLYRRVAADLCGSVELHTATVEELEQWAHRQRRSGRGGATASVKRDMDVARSLFGFAAARGLLARNPAAELITPKRRSRSPAVVAPDLFSSAWGQAAEHDRVLLALMRYAGLRRAEAASLRWGSLSPYRDDGTLRRVVRKGGSEATVPLGDCLTVYERKAPDLLLCDRAWLRAWVGVHQGGPVRFVFPQSAGGSFDWVNKRVRVLSDGAFTPHALRHTFASDMARLGMPLAVLRDLLNHSDIGSTMRYVHSERADVLRWL